MSALEQLAEKMLGIKISDVKSQLENAGREINGLIVHFNNRFNATDATLLAILQQQAMILAHLSALTEKAGLIVTVDPIPAPAIERKAITHDGFKHNGNGHAEPE